MTSVLIWSGAEGGQLAHAYINGMSVCGTHQFNDQYFIAHWAWTDKEVRDEHGRVYQAINRKPKKHKARRCKICKDATKKFVGTRIRLGA